MFSDRVDDYISKSYLVRDVLKIQERNFGSQEEVI